MLYTAHHALSLTSVMNPTWQLSIQTCCSSSRLVHQLQNVLSLALTACIQHIINHHRCRSVGLPAWPAPPAWLEAGGNPEPATPSSLSVAQAMLASLKASDSGPCSDPLGQPTSQRTRASCASQHNDATPAFAVQPSPQTTWASWTSQHCCCGTTCQQELYQGS